MTLLELQAGTMQASRENTTPAMREHNHGTEVDALFLLHIMASASMTAVPQARSWPPCTHSVCPGPVLIKEPATVLLRPSCQGSSHIHKTVAPFALLYVCTKWNEFSMHLGDRKILASNPTQELLWWKNIVMWGKFKALSVPPHQHASHSASRLPGIPNKPEAAMPCFHPLQGCGGVGRRLSQHQPQACLPRGSLPLEIPSIKQKQRRYHGCPLPAATQPLFVRKSQTFLVVVQACFHLPRTWSSAP